MLILSAHPLKYRLSPVCRSRRRTTDGSLSPQIVNLPPSDGTGGTVNDGRRALLIGSQASVGRVPRRSWEQVGDVKVERTSLVNEGNNNKTKRTRENPGDITD